VKTTIRWIANKLNPNGDIHDPEVRYRIGSLEGWTSITINMLLFLVKGFLGLITGSVALIADAFHTLSDISTSIIIILSFRWAKKPSDISHPFGHGRMEAIATLVVAVLLSVAGIEILKSGFEQLFSPKPFQASWLIILIVSVTIIVKELLARFSKELGILIESDTLKADFWHHRTDAISSLLVIAAFLGQRFGLLFLDGLMGIFVSIMILYTAWVIAKNGIDDLLGKKPSNTLVEKVKAVVRDFPQVLDVHDLIIHQYGRTNIMSFHIEVPCDMTLKNAHTLSENVEKIINRTFHTYSTVHLDPVNQNDPVLKDIRIFLKTLKENKKKGFTFHDLRSVGKDNEKNIYFDLVIDPAMTQGDINDLQKEIRSSLMESFSSIKDVIMKVEPIYAL
jgi:cation diffusion facilitator family transporter